MWYVVDLSALCSDVDALVDREAESVRTETFNEASVSVPLIYKIFIFILFVQFLLLLFVVIFVFLLCIDFSLFYFIRFN